MARGRMLNKSISTDKVVAQLVNELGGYAGMVFSWLIAHLDREGRFHGDPEVIKGNVFPRIAGITPAFIRQTAARCHELGLVVWYESGGDLYIAMPGFDKNQPGMRKDREPESSFPTAPCGDLRTALPEGCRQIADKDPPEVEVNRSRIKTIVPLEDQRDDLFVGEPEKAEPDLAETVASYVLEVFAHYRENYHKRSHPKPSSKSKEWRLIRDRLAEGYTVADLKLAIDGIHKSKFHLGENDRHTKYLELERVVKSSTNVAKFLEAADQGLAAPPRPARPSSIIPDSEREEMGEEARREVEELKKSLRIGGSP